MMDTVRNQLQLFDKITLEEMDRCSLMARVDSKYVFHIRQLPGFLNQIRGDYRVLEINRNTLQSYQTLYYDTHHFDIYMDHLKGKGNRYKVRSRKYMETNRMFFEIKSKTNKNYTLKERISVSELPEVITDRAGDFLSSKIDIPAEQLLPKLWVYYSRITLVNTKICERLTLDLNLHYSSGDRQKYFPELVIAELKHNQHQSSRFSDLMRENRVNSKSISKYCFGVASVHEGIKHNLFKPKMLYIDKLCHEFS